MGCYFHCDCSQITLHIKRTRLKRILVSKSIYLQINYLIVLFTFISFPYLSISDVCFELYNWAGMKSIKSEGKGRTQFMISGLIIECTVKPRNNEFQGTNKFDLQYV